MKYVGFGKRLLAYIIDAIILIGATAFIGDSNIKQTIDAFLWIPYFVWMNGQFGASIGKMVMGIKIVKENGKPITYGDALVREIASILSLAILFLGFITIIWDKKKQSWHDKIAK